MASVLVLLVMPMVGELLLMVGILMVVPVVLLTMAELLLMVGTPPPCEDADGFDDVHTVFVQGHHRLRVE